MMYYLDGRWRRQSLVYFGKVVRLMSANVAGGAFREARGYVPGRYSEIFGLGERLGCILNLSHSFDAIGVVQFASKSITMARSLAVSKCQIFGRCERL